MCVNLPWKEVHWIPVNVRLALKILFHARCGKFPVNICSLHIHNSCPRIQMDLEENEFPSSRNDSLYHQRGILLQNLLGTYVTLHNLCKKINRKCGQKAYLIKKIWVYNLINVGVHRNLHTLIESASNWTYRFGSECVSYDKRTFKAITP